MKKRLLTLMFVASALFSAGMANAQDVDLVSKNAYAYDIAVTTTDKDATVTYRLNAIATAVEVQAWADGQIVSTYEGTTNAGLNTVDILTTLSQMQHQCSPVQ